MLEDKAQANRCRGPNNRLVVDVGMNDGRDTAYYLHCGCRVTAVEANPQLAATANACFAQEIAEGMLAVLNLRIAPSEGVAGATHRRIVDQTGIAV